MEQFVHVEKKMDGELTFQQELQVIAQGCEKKQVEKYFQNGYYAY